MAPSAAHCLNVEEDCLDRLLPHLLHASHGAGPEEDFGVAEPPLVVHLLDRLQNHLCSLLQVGTALVNLFWFDDDEAVNKVRIDSPEKELLSVNDIFAMFHFE